MSRIGKMPIALPKGAEATVTAAQSLFDNRSPAWHLPDVRSGPYQTP